MDFHSVPDAEVDDAILSILCELARGKYVVESGTFLGKSARAMARVARRVDTCDPCDLCWGVRRFPPNVVAHHCRGVEFVPSEPVGLCFIDSDIDGRGDEVEHFGPTMAPDGVIAVDDPDCSGIRQALDRLDYRYVVLPISHGLILAQPN